MDGLRFDFEANDIVLTSGGSFEMAEVSSQCCALIAVSEVCRLTAPEVGERLATKLENRNRRAVSSDIAAAVRAVERDGGKRVSITIDSDQQLQFYAEYGEN